MWTLEFILLIHKPWNAFENENTEVNCLVNHVLYKTIYMAVIQPTNFVDC